MKSYIIILIGVSVYLYYRNIKKYIYFIKIIIKITWNKYNWIIVLTYNVLIYNVWHLTFNIKLYHWYQIVNIHPYCYKYFFSLTFFLSVFKIINI